MVDIETFSVVLASASVVAGIIYYAFELRNQAKIRQTDLIMRLQSAWRSRELRESYRIVMGMKFKDYNEFAKQNALWEGAGTPETRAVAEVGYFFDGIGILLHRKLIDIEMVDELFSFYIKAAWEKLKPGIEGRRKKKSTQHCASGSSISTMKCEKESTENRIRFVLVIKTPCRMHSLFRHFCS